MGESAERDDAVAGPRTTLPPDVLSTTAARRFISDVLHRRGMDPLADVGALLTSELVTNAVLYARSDIVLQVVISSSSVRVEVHDASTEPPVARLGRPNEAVPGHGLDLVASLAHSWGVHAEEAGKCVWFELCSARDDEAAELRPVVLLNVPVSIYVALNLHVDQLLHELQTATGGHWGQAAVSQRLHRLITRSLESQTAARASAWIQAREAMAAGGARADIELSVPAAATTANRQLLELLEEADSLCAAGELLTLPMAPEVRELQRWVGEELSSQLQFGSGPRRCPL